MVNEENDFMSQANGVKSKGGNELQRNLCDLGTNHLEKKGFVQGVDFYIYNEQYFNPYAEKYVKLFGEDFLITLSLVSSLEELLMVLKEKENYYELKRDLVKFKSIEEFRALVDKTKKSDIVLWLKFLPEIVFIFEVTKSIRNGRTEEKERHSEYLIKAIEYKGYKPFYSLLVPNDENFCTYKNEKTEINQINFDLMSINRSFPEIIGMSEPLNLFIRVKDFLDFLDFIVKLKSNDVFEIEYEFKKLKGFI